MKPTYEELQSTISKQAEELGWALKDAEEAKKDCNHNFERVKELQEEITRLSREVERHKETALVHWTCQADIAHLASLVKKKDAVINKALEYIYQWSKSDIDLSNEIGKITCALFNVRKTLQDSLLETIPPNPEKGS